MADQILREKNAKLEAQNELLKSQLELQKTLAPPNSKIESVLADIIKWFDRVPPALSDLGFETPRGSEDLHLELPRTESPRRSRTPTVSPRFASTATSPSDTPSRSRTPTRSPRIMRTTATSPGRPRTPTPRTKTRSTSPYQSPTRTTATSPRRVHLANHETQTDQSARSTARENFKQPVQVPPLNLSDLTMPETPRSSRAPIPVFPFRVLGEVAFQLDRRILSYIFNGQAPGNGSLPPTWRQRFYGFTIHNIPEMIAEESTTSSGRPDNQLKMCFEYRNMHIMRCLAKLGYDARRHGRLSVKLVNKHGLLLAEDRQLQTFGLQDPELVRKQTDKLFLSVSVEEDPNDFMVLLNCLVYLATQDGRPLFVF